MFDEGGKVVRVHIFCAGTKNEDDCSSLFSELELAYFKEQNIELVFSDLLLHSDDTIRNAKHKIIPFSITTQKQHVSKNLQITAETDDGLIMGVQHKEFNIHGVQFHPESIKTKIGIKILKNFIKLR